MYLSAALLYHLVLCVASGIHVCVCVYSLANVHVKKKKKGNKKRLFFPSCKAGILEEW